MDLGVIVGSGPSLEDFDFASLERDDLFTVALNMEATRNQTEYRPDRWQFQDNAVIERLRNFRPHPDTQIAMLESLYDQHVKDGTAPSWFHDGLHWPRLHNHRAKYTVATAAVRCLVEDGFSRIALLGCDCRGGYYDKAQPGHDWYHRKTRHHESVIEQWALLRDELLAAGNRVTIYQTCLDSPLDVFPKVSFDELLQRKERP